jgi:hypothetical protein
LSFWYSQKIYQFYGGFMKRYILTLLFLSSFAVADDTTDNSQLSSTEYAAAQLAQFSLREVYVLSYKNRVINTNLGAHILIDVPREVGKNIWKLVTLTEGKQRPIQFSSGSYGPDGYRLVLRACKKGEYPLVFVREMEDRFPEKIIVNVYIR